MNRVHLDAVSRGGAFHRIANNKKLQERKRKQQKLEKQEMEKQKKQKHRGAKVVGYKRDEKKTREWPSKIMRHTGHISMADSSPRKDGPKKALPEALIKDTSQTHKVRCSRFSPIPAV